MTNKIPVILFDDIEQQIAPLFSREKLYDITVDFIRSVGKSAPISKIIMLCNETNGYYSKERIIRTNLSVLTDTEKIEFLKQISDYSKIAENENLKRKILKIVSEYQQPSKSRKRTSNLLKDYPSEIGDQWEKAQEFYDEADYRNALDSIRLTMELLVKNITQTDASLENQKKNLGPHLKDKGISKQIRNFFFGMLDVYEKIQNNNVKHNVPSSLSKAEVKFLMNQSYVIISFLIDCDKKVE